MASKANEAADTPRFRQLSDKDRELLRKGLCSKCTVDDFELFVETCNKTGLDPFMRQIYPVFRSDRKTNCDVMQIQVSIDGMRLVAERSGHYAGQVGPFWCGKDGSWKDVWLSDREYPVAAKVGVMRHDFKEVLWAAARFQSYVQTKFDGKPNQMWGKFPDVMIAKCAEALALRKAFPMELSGLYSTEEMSQADNPETANAGKLNVSPDTAPKTKSLETANVQETSPQQPIGADTRVNVERRARAIKALTAMLIDEAGLGLKAAEAADWIKRTVARDDITGMESLTDVEIARCMKTAKDAISKKVA